MEDYLFPLISLIKRNKIGLYFTPMSPVIFLYLVKKNRTVFNIETVLPSNRSDKAPFICFVRCGGTGNSKG